MPKIKKKMGENREKIGKIEKKLGNLDKNGENVKMEQKWGKFGKKCTIEIQLLDKTKIGKNRQKVHLSVPI